MDVVDTPITPTVVRLSDVMEARECKRCRKTLAINAFEPLARGHRRTCRECARKPAPKKKAPHGIRNRRKANG